LHEEQAENEKGYSLAVVNILEMFYTVTSRPTVSEVQYHMTVF